MYIYIYTYTSIYHFCTVYDNNGVVSHGQRIVGGIVKTWGHKKQMVTHGHSKAQRGVFVHNRDGGTLSVPNQSAEQRCCFNGRVILTAVR